jgi:[ribosomal protein S18]-alanine N-acetyltransferase
VAPEPQPPLAFTIRAFRPTLEDAAAASAILRDSKDAAPWPQSALQPGGFDPSTTLALFSQIGETPTGFIIGRHAADEGEILNLAVSASSRRQGQGQALVNQLFQEFRDHSVVRVFLEVRESNSAAIAFYEKLGFRLSGRRPSYYRDPVEAALLYSKLLESTG